MSGRQPLQGFTLTSTWRWRQALIGLAVGAALLALSAGWASVDEVLKCLGALDSRWAGLALIAYCADLALRVIRWRLLFSNVATLPVLTFARALVVGYGLNILLPARLGELARIEYLKLRTETRRSSAIPAILVERAMDGTLVLAALILGLLAAHSTGAGSPILAGLIGCGGAMVALLIALPVLLHRTPAWIDRRLPARAAESLARARSAVGAMRSGMLGGAALLTFAVYLAEAAAIGAMLKAVGAVPTPALLLTILGAASLSTLLPTAPGFLGSYQLAYALVLELFGQEPAVGAAAATAVQVVLFAPVVLAALLLALSTQRMRAAPALPQAQRAR